MKKNTPSGTKKHGESTDSESRHMAKMFLLLLLLLLLLFLLLLLLQTG